MRDWEYPNNKQKQELLDRFNEVELWNELHAVLNVVNWGRSHQANNKELPVKLNEIVSKKESSPVSNVVKLGRSNQYQFKSNTR